MKNIANKKIILELEYGIEIFFVLILKFVKNIILIVKKWWPKNKINLWAQGKILIAQKINLNQAFRNFDFKKFVDADVLNIKILKLDLFF